MRDYLHWCSGVRRQTFGYTGNVGGGAGHILLEGSRPIVPRYLLLETGGIIPSQAWCCVDWLARPSQIWREKATVAAWARLTAASTNISKPFDADSISHLHVGVFRCWSHFNDGADTLVPTNLEEL